MWKRWSVVLTVLGLWPGLAGAVEIKNVRITHGPLGALRAENKFLPGDVVFMMFDIGGLKVDPKIGKASYEILHTVLDSSGGLITSNRLPQNNILGLGGNSVPGFLVLELSPKQNPGKYTVKLKIKDRNGTGDAETTVPFEIVPVGFGIVGAVFPAVGVPAQEYLAQFGIAHMGLDKKKQPSAVVKMRILDAAGKEVGTPLAIKYPQELSDEEKEKINFEKSNFIGPIFFKVFLNRPGRFTLIVEAQDKLSNKKTELRAPLTVLDLNQVTGPAIGSK